MRLGPFVLAVLVAAPVAAGQSGEPAQGPSIDARWLPWVGCWRPAPQRSSDGSLYLCVVPAGPNGARILTISGTQVVAEETIVPDGTDRQADDPSCRGSQRRAWSADGQRLYATAELNCDNQPARTVSGLSTLTAEGEWIDVQVVVSGTQERVRIRRHQRSDDQPPDASLIPSDVAARAATSPRGTRLTIANVIEASSLVAPRVLEALIFETRASFPIDSRQLISMDDAGVADEVIDVMVAFSFPEKFKVTRSAGASSWGGFDSGGLEWGGMGVTAEYAWPWYLNPYYSYVGFPYWGVGGDYYYPGWGVEVGGGDGTVVPPEPHGRVVNGRGYTQVLRAPEGGGQPTPRSGGNTSSTSGADGGSSSGGTSSATSGGYSSGGGGDSGRTAVPR